jgi:hypothetical protein
MYARNSRGRGRILGRSRTNTRSNNGNVREMVGKLGTL